MAMSIPVRLDFYYWPTPPSFYLCRHCLFGFSHCSTPLSGGVSDVGIHVGVRHCLLGFRHCPVPLSCDVSEACPTVAVKLNSFHPARPAAPLTNNANRNAPVGVEYALSLAVQLSGKIPNKTAFSYSTTVTMGAWFPFIGGKSFQWIPGGQPVPRNGINRCRIDTGKTQTVKRSLDYSWIRTPSMVYG